MTAFFIFLGVLLVAGYLYKQNKKTEAPAVVKALYPCVIEGTIDHSPYADKLKALQIEAASKGLTMTGDYTTDYLAQGGEMTLAGNFKIILDEKGNVVNNGSHFNLFGSLANEITGAADANGVLGMDANFGGAIINIRGRIVGSTLVDGKAIKSWLPHIWGIMNGNVQSL